MLIRLIPILIVLTGVAGCASLFEISARHGESGFNSTAFIAEREFPEYVTSTRRMIARARLDPRTEVAEYILDANSPYELLPASTCARGEGRRAPRGVLLIHGLTDSPYQTRDIAHVLHKRCFLVRAILLPGHGTVPGDMLSVDRSAWVAQVRWAVAGLAADAEDVYIAGFSTGGVLAVQAALAGHSVRGLILISPALRIRNPFAVLSGVVRHVRSWLEVAPDDDYAKYESFTTNAAYQIYRLTSEVQAVGRSSYLLPPVFIAVSAEDATTESGDTLAFFAASRHSASRLLYYSRKPATFTDSRARVVLSTRPEAHILEQSHISLGVAPENLHYGAMGKYRNCKHYLHDRNRWDICKAQTPIVMGERDTPKPAGTVFARTTYNPDFEDLARELVEFVDRVSTRD